MSATEHESTTMNRGKWAARGLLAALFAASCFLIPSDAEVEAQCPARRVERSDEPLDAVAFAVSESGLGETDHIVYVCPASAPIDSDAVLEHHHRPVGGAYGDLPSPAEHCWLLYEKHGKHHDLEALREGVSETRLHFDKPRVTTRAKVPGETTRVCFGEPARSGPFEIVGLLEAEYCGEVGPWS